MCGTQLLNIKIKVEESICTLFFVTRSQSQSHQSSIHTPPSSVKMSGQDLRTTVTLQNISLLKSQLSLFLFIVKIRLRVLAAKMMPDNGMGHGHYSPAEAESLAREKAELAQQVMMLKQQLQGSVSYSGHTGSYAGTSYAGNSASYNQGFRDDRSVGSMGSRGHRTVGNGYNPQGYSQGDYPQGGYPPGPPRYPGEIASQYSGYNGPTRDGEAALYDEYRQGLSVAPTRDGPADDVSIDSYEDRSVRSNRSNRSGSKSVHSIRSARSARSAASKNSKLSKRAKNGFEPPLQDYKRPESPPGSQAWRSLAFICTFMIPDACVPKQGAGPKQAWRYVVYFNLSNLLSHVPKLKLFYNSQ